MAADFVGRAQELELLRAASRAPDSSLIPIYGRRRVGKSALILRFLQDHPGIYFLGKQAPAGLQLREFQDEAAVVLGEPLLASATFDGWKAAVPQRQESDPRAQGGRPPTPSARGPGNGRPKRV